MGTTARRQAPARSALCAALVASQGLSAGCGDDGPNPSPSVDAGADASPDRAPDTPPAPDAASSTDGANSEETNPEASGDVDVDARSPDAPTKSRIEHVILIVQENHTFDSYFGRYCTAPAGSRPTCTTGPECCEAAPDREPSGSTPVTLDDAATGAYDPNHSRSCEAAEINGGLMDRYVRGASCSNASNFGIAPAAIVAKYHALAQSYALAAAYFQPIVGATASNNMYFAVAHQVFYDNDFYPPTSGADCGGGTKRTFTGDTIADLLVRAGYTFATYAEGYAIAQKSATCGPAPADCPAQVSEYPCLFDPSDIPFQYYATFNDNPKYMKDFVELAADIDGGKMPTFAYVKSIGYRTEHPGSGTTISAGVTFVDGVVQKVLGSSYALTTLVLLAYDEGGGYFDHVAPPPASTVDGEAYGTRLPFLAIGRFARKNFISHVTMEHSSVVKFLEYNFLGATGQLKARDAVVNNIGSLLDPGQVGVVIPD